MQPPPKIFSTFDKFILTGLGCGLIILCAIGGWIYYIVQTLPGQRAEATQVVFVENPTQTSNPPILESPTALLPSPIVTITAPPADLIPTPLPASFDGTPPSGKIVFVCYVQQIDQICLMNADGTQREQLTDFEATAFYPSLAGDTVYFSSRQTGNYEVYSMGINDTNPQRLTRNIGSLYAPELSPDGEWVIFTKNGDGLWLMRPDGGNPRRLTNRDDIDPTWSPDGSQIAFASSRSGARQLFVMNADGSNIQQVTNLTDMGGRSTWSPDGTKLAFYRGEFGNRNIYVINVDGTGLIQLTNGGDNLGPSWSPDGNWIAFTSFRDGNNEIYIIHPDGTGATRLTNSPISDWQPRWGR